MMGFENSRALLETLPNKIHNKLGLLVDVALRQQEGRECLEIVVQGICVPVSYSGKFYRRSGSNTVELTGSNLTHFLKKYGKTWDDIAEERFSLADIDPLTIEKFKRLARERIPGVQDEQETQALLRKLNLYDGEHLKRSAILLFGRNPQQYYIQSHSKIGRFLSETDIQSSDIIEGNLIDQVDRLMDVLCLKYLKAYISYEGMHRRETLEYPYDALREAIINALIHRDYTDTSNLQIRVYDDRLVMYNGATLSREVPIEKFDQPHQSKLFNPTMAAVFYRCGYIENRGRGTLNIIGYCLQAGLPKPEFSYDWGAVRATFYRRPAQGERGGGVKELLVFGKNPGLTAKAISEAMGTPLRTVERWLKTLREQGKIEYQGAPRTGGYVVKAH